MSFDRDMHLKKLLKVGEHSDVSTEEFEIHKSSKLTKDINSDDPIVKVQNTSNVHIVNKNNDGNLSTNFQNTSSQNDETGSFESSNKKNKNSKNKEKNARNNNKQGKVINFSNFLLNCY